MPSPPPKKKCVKYSDRKLEFCGKSCILSRFFDLKVGPMIIFGQKWHKPVIGWGIKGTQNKSNLYETVFFKNILPLKIAN